MGVKQVSAQKIKEIQSDMDKLYKELHEFENDSLKKLEQWEKGILAKQAKVNKKDKNYMVSIEKSHDFFDFAKILNRVLNEKCPTYKPLVSALTGTVNILISGDSTLGKSKQGFYLNSQGLGINKFHYFLYVRELKILIGQKNETVIFIGYSCFAAQTQLRFDDMIAAVEKFQLSKQEKKIIWRELAPKTIDGEERIDQIIKLQRQISKKKLNQTYLLSNGTTISHDDLYKESKTRFQLWKQKMIDEYGETWFKSDYDSTVQRSQQSIFTDIKKHINELISRLGSDSDSQAFYKSICGLIEGMIDKAGYGSNISGKYRVMCTTTFHFIIYSRKIHQQYYFSWGFCVTKSRRIRCPNNHQMILKKQLGHNRCNICRNSVSAPYYRCQDCDYDQDQKCLKFSDTLGKCPQGHHLKIIPKNQIKDNRCCKCKNPLRYSNFAYFCVKCDYWACKHH